MVFVRFAFPGRFTEMGRYFSLDYRVMYHLQQDTIYMSPQVQCHLDCLGMDQSDVLAVLDGGEVNFDKSEKNSVPCKLYTVEKEALSVLFELCEEKVKVRDFSLRTVLLYSDIEVSEDWLTAVDTICNCP